MEIETIISSKTNSWPKWQEVWQFRDMLWALSLRDIKLRYQETILGIFWVLFQPAVVTTIFTIIFGRLAKLPSDGLPYPLFTYAGLIFWNFFSAGLSATSNSLSTGSGLLSKIAFPKIILPLSALLTVSVDFFVSLIPLILMFFYFGIFPLPITIFVFPILVAITSLTILGVGMFLAPICIYYRDTRYLLNFLLQIGLFVTPVVYPLTIIYDWKRIILILNPLTGIIETFRGLLGATKSGGPEIFIISLIISLAIFIFGLWQFQKQEKEIVDIL